MGMNAGAAGLDAGENYVSDVFQLSVTLGIIIIPL